MQIEKLETLIQNTEEREEYLHDRHVDDILEDFKFASLSIDQVSLGRTARNVFVRY